MADNPAGNRLIIDMDNAEVSRNFLRFINCIFNLNPMEVTQEKGKSKKPVTGLRYRAPGNIQN